MTETSDSIKKASLILGATATILGAVALIIRIYYDRR